MFDHVTYEVNSGDIIDGVLEQFMYALEFIQVPVDEEIPEGWKAAWFAYCEEGERTVLHFVEVPFHDRYLPEQNPYLGAGHFCVEVSQPQFQLLKQSTWVERDSGQGRLWLRACGLRVEVRAKGVSVVPTGEGFSKDAQGVAEGRSGSISTDPGARINLMQSTDQPTKLTNYQRQDVSPAVYEHSKVLDKALEIYEERTAVYGDRNWRREGWQGAVFNLRRKVERAWDVLWDKEHVQTNVDVDDLLDIINYAVFTIRAIDEGHEGDWFDAS